MADKQIIIEISEGIAVITINRHEERNMLGAQTLEEFGAALEEIEKDEAVTAVVITGAGGKAFCAGAEITGGFDLSGDVKEFVRAGQALFTRIERFPKPVVAAVEGYALGGGCELMLSCDVVVASEKAAVGLPEAGLGLMPGWRGTQVVPRIVGKNLAMELLLLGGRIRAPRAAEMGLVNKVVPKGNALLEAKELAGRLGRMPAHSIRLIKEAVTKGLEMPMEEALELEAENFERAFKKIRIGGKIEKRRQMSLSL